jgi:hypothetical protein
MGEEKPGAIGRPLPSAAVTANALAPFEPLLGCQGVISGFNRLHLAPTKASCPNEPISIDTRERNPLSSYVLLKATSAVR